MERELGGLTMIGELPRILVWFRIASGLARIVCLPNSLRKDPSYLHSDRFLKVLAVDYSM
jgi:hypothetical protein